MNFVRQVFRKLSYRITSCECVYLVTRGHFRSRDKDGGHTIQSVIAQNAMLHATSWLCGYRAFARDTVSVIYT